ncbi:MAG: AraC family transcriptional regulator ligand-binding domain-containing protein [Myxococcota bacterium]
MFVPAAACIAILDGFEAAGGSAREHRVRLGSALKDPESTVPIDTWRPSFEAIAAHSDRPTWAMEVGLAVPYGAFGLVDYLVGSAPTIRDALQTLESSFAGFSARVTTEVEDTAAGLLVSFDSPDSSTWALEFSLGVTCGRVRAFVDEVDPVVRVSVTGRDATPAYSQLLGVPVAFGAERGSVLVRTDVLEQPLNTTEDRLFASLTRVVEPMLQARSSEKTADALRRCLRRDPAKLDSNSAARALGVSERTLARRLASEGTSFRDVQTSVKAEESERRLLRGDALIDIATGLGYQDQSAWTKAFRRWKGTTPSAWLAEHSAR